MQVRAKEACFIGGARRRKGEVFEYGGTPSGPIEAADGSQPAPKEKEKAKDEGPTRKEIMAQLEAAGVKYGNNDNKDALLALLNAARKEAAPASSDAPDKSVVGDSEAVE